MGWFCPPLILRGMTLFHRRLHFPASKETAAALRPPKEASASNFSAWDPQKPEIRENYLWQMPRPPPVQTSVTQPPPCPFLPTWCHPRSSGLRLEPAAPRDPKVTAASATCLNHVCCVAGNPPSCCFVCFQRPVTALGGISPFGRVLTSEAQWASFTSVRGH